EGIDHYKRLLDVEPKTVAHDLHPGYLATQYALELANVRRIGVQHHHAHIAAVLAEHGIGGPVIGVAFDGTGYGTDGCIWGGEFLLADPADFQRVAHLEYVPMPGGEGAIRQPWRMAAAHLYRAYDESFLKLDLPFARNLERAKWRTLRRMMDAGINAPVTSSMGRLFDAVAALVTGRAAVTYEGQAAVELERIADPDCTETYSFGLAAGEGSDAPLLIPAAPVLRAVVEDLQVGVAPNRIAAKFHNGVAGMVIRVCRELRERHRLNGVALSGGVFQNALLLERTLAGLQAEGFEVHTHQRVPPNDGGIALGQAAVAAARIGGRTCA
ncbi:MAG: carbamoyltransferase HypF, partial [Armatimonadetes bacterium]|nr:carbamoyltransferase HypF [Armatimonadota bacterium]